MEPQVALEQSGSTRAARVLGACRAFPTESGLSAPGREFLNDAAARAVRSLPGGMRPPPWGYPLPLCPRLGGSPPPCLYIQERVRVRDERR